jgi:hypothetical protein
VFRFDALFAACFIEFLEPLMLEAFDHS